MRNQLTDFGRENRVLRYLGANLFKGFRDTLWTPWSSTVSCSDQLDQFNIERGFDGRNAELAGGFPSNPILSGPRRTVST